MQERKVEAYLFFGLLGLSVFLTFKIFEPYLYSLIVAIIFAVVFHPLYKRILSYMPKWQSFSTLVTIFIIFVLVLLPLVFFGIQISNEIVQIYGYVIGGGANQGFLFDATNAANNLLGYFDHSHTNIAQFSVVDTKEFALNIFRWFKEHFVDIFTGLTKFVVAFFFFAISLFYLLKDGERFRKDIIMISPFNDTQDEVILHKIKIAILSVLKGSIFVAIIQGIMSSFGYYFFGVPSAALWGGLTAISSLIPGIGTSLVVGPAIVYLFLTGAIPQAIGLLIYGTIIVGFVDNLIGPKFVERGVNIHPLIILISALGGLSFFGPIGFILGPLTTSFLYALFDIYKNIIVKDGTIR